jgi:DNA-binding IclR family transcriptional regulator
MPRQGDTPATLQTADRALRILQLFATPGEAISVAEVSRRLALNRSTASRLVSTLEARGFLERRLPAGPLSLGSEVARLGRLALGARDLVGLSRPLLEQLSAQTGETATLGVPAGDRVAIVGQSHGRHHVSSGNWVGVRTPPHCCSDGKVLLAYGALAVGPGPLPRIAANTIVDRRALARELRTIRQRGFAVAEGELEDGLVGVAVPVRDRGICVAALCVSGPRYRLDVDAIETFVPVCRGAADELEARLGSMATPLDMVRA